jgi:Mg2+ and Co2+ transporter CorA
MNMRIKKDLGPKKISKKGIMLWVDLVNPTESELSNLQQSFNFDNEAFETYEDKIKKPGPIERELRELGKLIIG